MHTKLLVIGLFLAGAACRRPSAQISATLSPLTDSTRAALKMPTSEITNLTQYLKAGDELVAFGNEPAWSLTINPSKNYLRFKTSGADSINVPMPPRNVDSNGRIRLQTNADQGILTALFRPDSCVDTMSGERFDYQVDVTYNGKIYTGCGVSLRELSLLNDIWVLQILNGKAVTAPAGRGELPRLEIQLAEGRVTGTTGCNRLNGSVLSDTRHIDFGNLATTRMMCPGETARLESEFLQALSQPLIYRVADGTLTLLHDNQPIMTFRKTD